MTLNLRSVIAQAHRSWRSVAPRCNFSSSTRESKNGQGKRAVCTIFIIRGLAMGVGYVIGEVYWHDWVQENQRKYDENIEYFERSEKMWAQFAAEDRLRSRAALVSDRNSARFGFWIVCP
ncbi:uncharacterized protein LOC103870911 isoform X2 [Brassica rapa]|uniref:uncharacterized protein LOC103870911 isoform X2 n=1 Tax=Brassica campestris TaxID=3711 RepID=UPI0004F1ACA6|nr:uncharacterized protein LOC103870911 isoform X2 [Brassica rapa]